MNAERLHLLIVEDEAAHVEAIRRAFEKADANVEIRAVGSLKEFRAALADRLPDVALVDLNLPDGKGLETMTVTSETLPFPILVMTAFGSQEMVVEVMKAGALDYVIKSPEAFASMPQTMDRAFREWRLIQKRKQAEEALRASEGRFRILFDRAADIILVLEIMPEGSPVIRDANSATFRILGYEQGELIGQPVSFIEEAPAAATAVEERRRVILSGTGNTFEARHRCKDGTIREFECSVSEMEIGSKSFAISVERDITEHKRADYALRTLSVRQEAILSAVPDIIMEVDDHKVYTWANPAGVAFFGDDVIGKEASFYFEGEQDVYTKVRPLFDGDENAIYIESWQRRKDGERRLLGWRCRALKDAQGNVRGALSTARDITEQRQIEAEMCAKAALLEAQITATIDGILIVDDKGNKIIQNQRCIDLWKIPKDIAESHDDKQQLEFVKNRTRNPEAFVNKVVYLYIHPNETSRDEVEFKDGMVLDRYSAPVIGKDGTHFGRIWVFRDITAQKLGEEALRKSNKELATALQELRKAQAQMVREERLSALGQMASGIAHDFNNVLVPIVGYSEMLVSHPEMLDDRRETLRLLGEMSTAAQDAKKIVKQLRLIRGTDDTGEQVPVDISEVAQSAVEMTRPRWDKEMGVQGHAINLVTRLEAGKLAMGNESELREALINLILNAVDAMPEGGTLTLSSAVEGDEAVMKVSDTGDGMTDETKARCLEPFFTTKGVKGTGLGLAMVQGIVLRHHGTTTIDSALGRGTTIQIRLPCAPDGSPAEETPVAKTDAHSTGSPLRILVADDDAKSRDLISHFLKKDGHVIEMARNGREAIDKANAMPFDLVLTDGAMPEANGDLVALAVKARTPETPVILLTGFGDIMKDEKDRPVGVDKILTKPVTRQELRHAIAEVMAGKGEGVKGQGASDQ